MLERGLTLVCQNNNYFLNIYKPGDVLPSFRKKPGKNKGSGVVYIILSIVLSIISILFLSIVFGPPAIYFGHKVKESKKRLGVILMAFSSLCMVVGLALEFILRTIAIV